jgi:transcriptional regulator with XRE-family HTH domain
MKERTKSKGAKLLTEWRGNRSQTEVAEILGCTNQQVSHWETGFAKPNADRRFAIAAATNGFVPAESWS